MISRRLPPLVLTVLATAAFVLVWTLASWSSLPRFAYVPGPIDVLRGIGEISASGELWEALAFTLKTTAISALVAILLGGLAGLALGSLPQLDRYYMASFDLLRSVPAIAVMPVAVLQWGPTGKTEVIVAAWVAFWPMFVNSHGGACQVPARLHEVASIFGLGPVASFVRITLPSSAPHLLVGARLAVTTALVVAIISEMLFSGGGLGWGIVNTSQALQVPQMWAYVWVCAVLGYLLSRVLLAVAQAAVPGSQGQGANA